MSEQSPRELRERLEGVRQELETNPYTAANPLAPILLELAAVADDGVTRLERIQGGVGRRTRGVFLALVASLVVMGLLLQEVDDRRAASGQVDAERDIATRYQRCLQTAESARGANLTRGITAGLARRLGEFTDAVASGASTERIQETAQALSQAANRAVAFQVEQVVPDCDGTYPLGAELSRKYGNQAPTITTPQRSSQ